MTSKSKESTAESRIEELEAEISALGEQKAAAEKEAQELEERVSAIDSRLEAISLAVYSGQGEAVEESATLEDERSGKQARLRIVRPAGEAAGREIEAKRGELKEARASYHQGLFRGHLKELEEKWEEADKRAGELASILEEVASLQKQCSREADQAGEGHLFSQSPLSRPLEKILVGALADYSAVLRSVRANYFPGTPPPDTTASSPNPAPDPNDPGANVERYQREIEEIRAEMAGMDSEGTPGRYYDLQRALSQARHRLAHFPSRLEEERA